MENKIYICYDSITEKEVCVTMGYNEKDVVRNLVLSGFFKVYRLKDIMMYSTGLTVLDRGGTGYEGEVEKVDVEKVLKELEIEFTNEAKEISKNPTEAKKIIIDKDSGK